MSQVMLTQTTTHRGVTSTKLCTMIEGKKFCEVSNGTPQDAGAAMLFIFAGIMMWALLSFVTFKILTKLFKLDFCDDWTTAVAIFSFIAPLAYFGLVMVIL